MKTNFTPTSHRRWFAFGLGNSVPTWRRARPASAACPLAGWTRLLRSLIAAGILLLAPGVDLLAQTVTQTFTLHAGWNILFLEVSPSNSAPGVVFANLPVASVWTRAEPVSTAQFIQDPNEAVFNEAEWLRWTPGQPDFVSTLRAVLGRRVYLLNLSSDPPPWQLTGAIAVRSLQWIPDRYNLRSFPIDPVYPPTFREFFQSSPAHYDRTQDRPRSIYRLGGDGKWVLADKRERMSPGEAYWVYCQGESTFTGPLEFSMDTGDTLDFGQELDRGTLRFRNATDALRTVTLRQPGTTVPGLFAYQRFNATNAFEWADLPNPFSFDLSRGSSKSVQLAIRRSLMPESRYTAVLEVTDGQGIRYRVPVASEKISASMPYAGLWAGNVTIQAVSQPHFGLLVTNLYVLVDGLSTPLDAPGVIVSTNESGAITAATARGPVPVYERIERVLDPQTPTPTKSEFTMRLLIHVDESGRSRLLKEVVQMWRDGTYTNDASGNRVVDNPGAYVLLTRDDLLSQFKGATLREGVPVGRRLSAIGFDFDGHGTNHLELAGAFGPGKFLTGEIQIAADYPLNPFRHKYHPDHDNLDPSFAPITDPARSEVYAIHRKLQFEFAAATKGNSVTPDPGYAAIEGVYRETLFGLHRQPIAVQGTFRLSRASFIPELNPSPTP